MTDLPRLTWDWLTEIDWLTLTYWCLFTDWLSLTDSLINSLIKTVRLTEPKLFRLTDWYQLTLCDWLIEIYWVRLRNRVIEWFSYWPTMMTEEPTYWDWLSDWLTDLEWLSDWDWLTETDYLRQTEWKLLWKRKKMRKILLIATSSDFSECFLNLHGGGPLIFAKSKPCMKMFWMYFSNTQMSCKYRPK